MAASGGGQRCRQLVEVFTAGRTRTDTALPLVHRRIAAHSARRERRALPHYVPGSGPLLATTLLAELPKFGMLKR